MSITAEKIARLIREKADVADNRWIKNSKEIAEAILSLLQQGEPVGWREAKRIADLWFEPWGAAKAIEWEFSGDVPFTPENALRKIQRLLSASPLPPATEQGWRPIETAPKDGTKIITFAPDGGIEVSFYYADTLENGTAYETWRDDGCEPTHWMPLPPAPGAETSE